MIRILLAAAAVALFATPVEAHVFGAGGAGFGDGFAHPFGGLDHLLAMVALGMWASTAGGSLRWTLPLGFLLFMAFGGAFGLAGSALPAVEAGIAFSVAVIGVLVAVAPRSMPVWAALAVTSFAMFHGHAHGAEIPEAASPMAYAAGFILATAALHVTGIAAGDLMQRFGRIPRQATGGALAIAGIVLLF